LYRAEISSDPRGRTLLGELHLKQIGPPRRVEEKIVDVQCALSIALEAREMAEGRSRFDSIVVCSQDIDLRPALEYATSQGVPVFVAAPDVVDRRPQPHLLLTPEPLRRFRQPTGTFGHDRRAQVAAAAMAPDVRAWSAVEALGDNGFWLLEDVDGTPGICRERHFPAPPRRGDVVRLGVAGITTGRTGNQFPLVSCDTRPAQAALALEATVRRRLRLNRLELDLQGRSVALPYPPGGVMVGWRVAVQVNAAGGLLPTHVVLGPLQPPTVANAVKTRVVNAEPIVATASSDLLSDSRTRLSSPLGAVVLDHPRGQHPPPGTRLAVVLADAGSYRFQPVVHAVSAPLA
jgi:hypothetical protein